MCTPGARRAATYLDWRGGKYRAAKSVGRQPSSVARDLSGDPWSATPDFDPIGKSGDRVGPNAPCPCQRDTSAESSARRCLRARTPTRARLPGPRIDRVTRRDVGVDHGCVSPSRAPLAPARSAPPHHDSVPRPVPPPSARGPGSDDRLPAHLRPTGASPTLTASSMTSAARSPWAPSAAAR